MSDWLITANNKKTNMKISFRVEAKKYNKKRLIEIMSEVKPGLDIVDAKKISKNARGENNLAV
tara:strand:- start:1848 stop:2036 length:189 start_codon:yes stop_codon:yes gene_type:complete